MVSLDVANSQPYFLLALLPRDVFSTEYVEKVVSGTFNADFKRVPGVDPARIKDELFKILFGKLWMMDRSCLTAEFKMRYPTVFKALKARKREVGDYREVAHSLQRLESNAIILGACGRLQRHHPEIPIITVHDNLITTKEYAGLVGGLMLEECEKVVGLRPTLKA